MPTFAPSATRVPSMSRMSEKVTTVDPGSVAEPTTVEDVADGTAGCATLVTSSGATIVKSPTNVDPSLNVAVAVYVPPGTMNPLSPAKSVNCVPPVIGNTTVPLALFSSGEPASTATPRAVPTPVRVLRVPVGPTRSIDVRTRCT